MRRLVSSPVIIIKLFGKGESISQITERKYSQYPRARSLERQGRERGSRAESETLRSDLGVLLVLEILDWH